MKPKEGQVRIPSGCAIAAVIARDGERMSGEGMIAAMEPMHDRSNGLGGGFAGYGIATQEPALVKRLNPAQGSERLVNLMNAWRHEIMELMGGMGINSVEALRGNRLMLRGVGLTQKEVEILGISHAGE